MFPPSSGLHCAAVFSLSLQTPNVWGSDTLEVRIRFMAPLGEPPRVSYLPIFRSASDSIVLAGL